MDKATIQFYNRHAQDYRARTANADLSSTITRFAAMIPAGGRVLDFGCGFGRDLSHFARLGFEVVGLEPSAQMAMLARDHARVRVIEGDATCLANETFDGIWACASLLHIPSRQIPGVLRALHERLVRGGAFYASVRMGLHQGRAADGRFFLDYQPEQLDQLLHALPWHTRQTWLTSDADAARPDITWINWLGVKPALQ